MLAPNPAFAATPAPAVPGDRNDRAAADEARNAHAIALLSAARRADPAGRRRLHQRVVVEYLDLARSIARRYRVRQQDAADVLQVACIGLAKAVERFDPDLGDDLVSFAVPTISGEIKQYLRDTSWFVRPPRRLQELAIEVPAVREMLEQELGRAPRIAELAAVLRRPLALVAEAVQCHSARNAISLHTPIPGASEELTLGDSLPYREAEFTRTELALTLERATRTLSEEERRIVRLRFEEQLTQTEIARECGVSQMQVSRLLASILQRLRAALSAEPARA
ncbi:sigma-70 family RNA polymerase sigma factor [Leucobacter chromiiresistens]|uniref:RNA polymerase sigma-B factor n=1 Tax=Leucobacter chromiiresistens TaxID=1079994 RepID=A0A1H0ZC12_9MICO|nr:sigma-70 family RNA polymerase sigma factor [Leucobacter chromiiresistens]SDQ24922.1 RNA polymerase sigma-B factor [Leucobacter chromiiresistens]